MRLFGSANQRRKNIVSVPLPGFSGLRQSFSQHYKLSSNGGFSPVAGIQWVETCLTQRGGGRFTGFSPVAGIQWVETLNGQRRLCGGCYCFSPVAGIQWVETFCKGGKGKEFWQVSVPLPGFSGLRPQKAIVDECWDQLFQSRCRDSVG